MATKKIQLTDRKNSFWISINRETGKKEKTYMHDMSDESLQKILITVQKSKIKAFDHFMFQSKIEAQILEAAKDRGAILKDIDHEKTTYLANRFGQFKEKMSSIYKSVLKTISKQEKEVEKDNKIVQSKYEHS